MGTPAVWMRNALMAILLAALFPAWLYVAAMALQALGLKDAGFPMLVLLCVPYGILGAILTRGTPAQRGMLVFVAVAIAGVGYEIFNPDARHPGAQLFVTTAIGSIPAVVALIYAGARTPAKRPEDGPSAKSGPTP